MDREDERESIAFETPVVLAVAFPGRISAPDDLRRCSQCGAQSQALSASELTVIKHEVSNQPLGQLRLYCREHLVLTKAGWNRGLTRGVDTAGPVCSNCFVLVPSGSKICDTCGVQAD